VVGLLEANQLARLDFVVDAMGQLEGVDLLKVNVLALNSLDAVEAEVDLLHAVSLQASVQVVASSVVDLLQVGSLQHFVQVENRVSMQRLGPLQDLVPHLNIDQRQ